MNPRPFKDLKDVWCLLQLALFPKCRHSNKPRAQLLSVEGSLLREVGEGSREGVGNGEKEPRHSRVRVDVPAHSARARAGAVCQGDLAVRPT